MYCLLCAAVLRYTTVAFVDSVWNVMTHGDTREEKWRGNKRMEWVTSKRHVTAEHRLARAIENLQADVYGLPANSRLNWRPRRFNPLNAELNPICHLLALLGAHLILHISRIRVKWTRPLRRKTKSGFCPCAITFQTQFTSHSSVVVTTLIYCLIWMLGIVFFSLSLFPFMVEWPEWKEEVILLSVGNWKVFSLWSASFEQFLFVRRAIQICMTFCPKKRRTEYNANKVTSPRAYLCDCWDVHTQLASLSLVQKVIHENCVMIVFERKGRSKWEWIEFTTDVERLLECLCGC